MKKRIVFEYSWESKKYHAENPNHKGLLGSIYDYGMDEYEILAMVTDTNVISNDFSTQLTCLFKILEANRPLFFEYCAYLEANKEIEIPLPNDENILHDQKLLTEYWNREAFILACQILIQKLLDNNSATSENTTLLYAILEVGKRMDVPVRIDNDVFNGLFNGETGWNYSKFFVLGENLINFPHPIIFEHFVLQYCRYAVDIRDRSEERYQDLLNDSANKLNLKNYVVMTD